MKDQRWDQLYEGAVFELDTAKLKERIDAAEEAIREREGELLPSTAHDEERQMIVDARQSLAVLRRTLPFL
jgi:ferric-dicitrate binding protein FerR (iron transport regulator)